MKATTTATLPDAELPCGCDLDSAGDAILCATHERLIQPPYDVRECERCAGLGYIEVRVAGPVLTEKRCPGETDNDECDGGLVR